MWLYVPRNLAPNPAIVVGLHWCTGNAQAYYQGTQWARYSETYGYIVIYPSTPYLDSNCWDVSSKSTLTRNGGGSSTSIANMVSFVTQQYGADKSKVYVTGTSSGAMMTNVMAATYPDVFAAGIAYSGVPAGCFSSAANRPAEWNSTCAQGRSVYTQQQWANVVKSAYPGYDGPRPKMQIYHGSVDEILNVQNHYETIKQWTGVFGYSTTATSTTPNYPRSPYTRSIFGDRFQAFLGSGVTHNVDVFPEEDLKWFGFVNPITSTSTTLRTTTTATTSTRPPTTTTSVPGTVPRWGQCGGIGYNGPTTCESGTTCVKSNDWYSQCI